MSARGMASAWGIVSSKSGYALGSVGTPMVSRAGPSPVRVRQPLSAERHQLGEHTPAADQLVVGAGLGDLPLVEDEDAIGVHQGGEAMRHEDDRAVGPARALIAFWTSVR